MRCADAPMAMCINRPNALASHFVSVASLLRRWLGARQRSSATVTLACGTISKIAWPRTNCTMARPLSLLHAEGPTPCRCPCPLPSTGDICRGDGHVRFVPIGPICALVRVETQDLLFHAPPAISSYQRERLQAFGQERPAFMEHRCNSFSSANIMYVAYATRTDLQISLRSPWNCWRVGGRHGCRCGGVFFSRPGHGNRSNSRSGVFCNRLAANTSALVGDIVKAQRIEGH